jgi:hypothetical protein
MGNTGFLPYFFKLFVEFGLEVAKIVFVMKHRCPAKNDAGAAKITLGNSYCQTYE